MTGKEIVSLWWATVLSQEDIGRTELMNLATSIDIAIASTHEDVRALAEDLQMAQGQWGNDYLWQKWGCSESLSRPTVRKIVEGP